MTRPPSPVARGRAAPSRRLSVVAALIAVAGLAWVLLREPLLVVAANRLVPGVPVTGAAVLGPALPAIFGGGAVAAGLLAASSGRRAGGVALALILAAGGLLAWGLGHGAALRMADQPPAARAGLGAGAWLAALWFATAFGLATRRVRRPGLGPGVACGLLVTLVLAGRAGAFDALSLAIEYAARRETVHAALWEHLALAGGGLGLAIPAAVALTAWRRGQDLVAIVLGGVQVIPAVALLGALVALTGGLLRLAPALRELGLSALGPAPAMVGIAAYLLLPFWRGLTAALRAPDRDSLDAARGLGLTETQILLRLRLPLGAPQLVGALRVAAVQALGLATLGALVGAGGLGRIVLDGMAQFAPDLILLGAIPIVALSLTVEGALSTLEDRMRARDPA
ncbi:osmoprotectant transport system permease protein [Methylobacterium gossipiicola]|uniref:Osmoprotectant transport system permease protein n=1 Tax=Methylobacterium gossipiicola TaxID=582675 RepID=A0A1I2U4Z3_9HYPH|nr:osmoprotectant transport system permease protein [Methylobacterium gossipiicola]